MIFLLCDNGPTSAESCVPSCHASPQALDRNEPVRFVRESCA